jgi:hypothetical protein
VGGGGPVEGKHGVSLLHPALTPCPASAEDASVLGADAATRREIKEGHVKAVLLGVVGFVAVIVSASCSSNSSSGSSAGAAGAACYPNGTCNSGLTCTTGTCVVAGSGSDGGGGGNDSGGGGSDGATANCAMGMGAGCTQGSTCPNPLLQCNIWTSTKTYQCFQSCVADSDCEKYGAGTCGMMNVVTGLAWCTSAPTSCTPLPAACTIMGTCPLHGNCGTCDAAAPPPTPQNLYVCTGGAMPTAQNCSPDPGSNQEYCCD